MAAEVASARKRKPGGFMALLSSAACEWFLMFLLFLDASLSYLLIKFARYCELETPCLLCSRLDNGFGEKKPGFYWSLLCSSHKEEISSQVSCSIHGKFADIHSMCEDCLTPIAMQNKSNSESHRLLVGKSWLDVDRSALQNLMLNKQIRCSSDIRTCSCCKKTWRAKSSAERLLEVNSIGFGASRANVKPPLPRAPGCSRFSRRDSLKRLREKFTGSMTQQSTGRSTVGAGTLSHVGYTKLKISSDSESEIPFSEDDDDGGYTDCSSKTYGKSEHNIQCNRRRLNESSAECEDSEKQKHQGFEGKPLTLDQPILLDEKQHKDVDSLSSDALVVHTVKDHEQKEACNEPNSPFFSELISVCRGFQPGDFPEVSFGALEETCAGNDSIFHMPAISVLSELLSLCSFPPSSSDLVITNQINDGGTSEKGDASGGDHTESAESTSSDDDHLSETNNVQQIDASTQTDENLEPSDRNASEPIKTSDFAKIEEDRPHISNSELGLLSKETSRIDEDEPRIDEDSSSQVLPVSTTKIEEDPVSTAKIEEDKPQISNSELGLLSKETCRIDEDEPRIDEDSSSQVLSVSTSKIEDDVPQISNSELGSLSKETSQKAPDKHDEPRRDEDSTSQVHPISASLKKNDSMYKFPDGITMSNVEGEDMVEQLKRQIEHDRNCLSSLYKELEEERNAAATAANEAMAMITRLQEEKAALHMDALQYLRMMEEQAEYDMEALERANDLLAEKDKELQDLEYELEFYRNKFPDKSKADNAQENSSLDNLVATHSETSTGASSNSKADKLLRSNGNCKPVNGSVSNLQDERIYTQNV